MIGAALGFGAQRGFRTRSPIFIITEKQYGFGDLVELTLGTSGEAMGTVEDVTLRVTKLRTADGELYTISNGQIFKTLNLSKEGTRRHRHPVPQHGGPERRQRRPTPRLRSRAL